MKFLPLRDVQRQISPAVARFVPPVDVVIAPVAAECEDAGPLWIPEGKECRGSLGEKSRTKVSR